MLGHRLPPSIADCSSLPHFAANAAEHEATAPARALVSPDSTDFFSAYDKQAVSLAATPFLPTRHFCPRSNAVATSPAASTTMITAIALRMIPPIGDDDAVAI